MYPVRPGDLPPGMIEFVISTPPDPKERKRSEYDSYGASGAHNGVELEEWRRSALLRVPREELLRIPFYAEKLSGQWRGQSRVEINVPTSQHLAALAEVLSHLAEPMRADVARPFRRLQFQMLAIASQIHYEPLQLQVVNALASTFREASLVPSLVLAEKYDINPLWDAAFRWLTHHCLRGLDPTAISAQDGEPPLFADTIEASLCSGRLRVSLNPLIRRVRAERDCKRPYWLPRGGPDAPGDPRDAPPEAPIAMVLEQDAAGAGGEGGRAGSPASSASSNLSRHPSSSPPPPPLPPSTGEAARGRRTGGEDEGGARVAVPAEQWEGEPAFEVGQWPLPSLPPLPSPAAVAGEEEDARRESTAGFPGLFRCYLRRYRHGHGAGRVQSEEALWRRTLARVLPLREEDAEAASRRPWSSRMPRLRSEMLHRPSRTELVAAAIRTTDGVDLHDGKTRHVFELRREEDDALILAAVAEDSNGHFLITRCLSDVSPGGPHHLGVVSAKLLGTWFQVRDGGIPASGASVFKQSPLAWVRSLEASGISAAEKLVEGTSGAVTREMTRACGWDGWDGSPDEMRAEGRAGEGVGAPVAGIQREAMRTPALAESLVAAVPAWERRTLADVSYDTNVMGTVPNSCKVTVWPAPMTEEADATPGRRVEQATDTVFAGFRPGAPITLRSRQPHWNDRLGAWAMDFRGRADRASKKNFQLVWPQGPRDGRRASESANVPGEGRVVFLLGKRGKDLYSLDFAEPLSPVVAMSIALTAFANKWAVA